MVDEYTAVNSHAHQKLNRYHAATNINNGSVNMANMTLFRISTNFLKAGSSTGIQNVVILQVMNNTIRNDSEMMFLIFFMRCFFLQISKKMVFDPFSCKNHIFVVENYQKLQNRVFFS